MMNPTQNQILDTLVFSDSEIYLKKFHIQRVFETYIYLGHKPNLHDLVKIYDEIETKYLKLIKPNQGLRLFFSNQWPINYSVETKEIGPLSTELRISLHHLKKHPPEHFRYKWKNRDFWNQFKLAPEEDVLLIAPDQNIIETSRFNVFAFNVESNIVFTPALSTNCLNGVYRRAALDKGHMVLPKYGKTKLIEKNILVTDLNNYKLFLGNSVRGLLGVNSS